MARYAKPGIKATAVNKPKVPPITMEPPPGLEGWMQNVNREAFFINPHLSLKDLGIVDAGLKHLIWTTAYGWPGRLVEPLIIYKELGLLQPDVKIVDYEEINKKRLPQFQYAPFGYRITDEYEVLHIYRLINQDALANEPHVPVGPGENSATPPDLPIYAQFFYNLFWGICSVDGAKNLALGYLQTFVVGNIIKGLTYLLHNMIN